VLLFAFAVIVHRARDSRACAIVTADGDEPGRLRDPEQTIYIDRRRAVLVGGRKRVLVVLFVPSVERDGVTTIDQQHGVDGALEMFGRVFGGATAYPRAQGIWRDDERGGHS
jgi:hypothetical protein